jgi:hypothetical protein
MKVIAMTVALAASCASAEPHAGGPVKVYEGYADFYVTLPGRLFSPSEQKKFANDTAPSGRLRPFWAGAIPRAGNHHVVELDGQDLLIDGRRLSAAKGRRFGSESAAALGQRASLYINERYVCVDGVAPTASGTGARHTHVTLVTSPYSTAAVRYELPSLFGSCLGLHGGEPGGPVRFYEAKYHYAPGQDQPDGLIVREFSVESSAFHETGREFQLTFTDPGNVYRFQVSREGN